MSSSIDYGTERVVDREKDDMASRRGGSHIPAPLRKKRNDDNYKRFITPIGNPMAALQKHMRSKSLSDLNAEKKEEENQRAQINSRYEEMEKLKAMLKEDEDSWKSKLQNWKNRRRSVTEDARKRKEEREEIEREAVIKSTRRKTKTYREIVEDKKRREQELAQFDDPDEYTSPKSSISEMPVKIITKDYVNGRKESSSSSESDNETFQPPSVNNYEKQTSNAQKPADKSKGDSKVQYMYTTTVTAQIGAADPPFPPVQRQKAEPHQAAVNIPRKTGYEPKQHVKTNSNAQPNKPVETSQPNSNVPKVLLRSKGQMPKRERPKSAHELTSGSSTLPRNFPYNPTPKPFVSGGSEFMRYRKTAFANRRNMWESMGSNAPSSKDPEPTHVKQSSVDLISSKPSEPVNTGANSLKPNQPVEQRNVSPVNAAPKQGSKDRHPPKVPLVTRAGAPPRPYQATTQQKPVVYPVASTAKLSSNGLSLTSPRISKQAPPIRAPPTQAPQTKKPASLFDDMKICINQRPKSEKGFGFTVRGGDDGKPVIVDSVSAGGAADICQLCVSDEILAINDVPLADCKTQDDIVQLIVSSVITGHLSLNIRRYGKPKKTSSLGLTGTKVVMTPGGFVQVRSDKPGSVSPQVMPKNRNPVNNIPSYTDKNNNNEEMYDEDLPPPPSNQELADSMQSPRGTGANQHRLTPNYAQNNSRTSPRYGSSSSEDSDEDKDVRNIQKGLDFEQVHLKRNDESHLRKKLKEEQERIKREEAQRELARQKLQEEARLEDLRVQEELKKIQARSQRQMEERRMMSQQRQSNSLPRGYQPPSNNRRNMGGMHWLVEEAERQRRAESAGKLRMNALSQSKKMDEGANSILPPHVIQHLTQR